MKKENRIIEAAIIALGLIVLGYCLKAGIDNFVNKDRQVNVKGLSENEVPANTVTWPLSFSQLGNDLPLLYQSVNRTRDVIVSFIKENGLSEDEITINSPTVYDRNSNMWSENKSPYRYQMTSSITVKTKKVEEVRKANDLRCSLYISACDVPVVYVNSKGDMEEMPGRVGEQMKKRGYRIFGLTNWPAQTFAIAQRRFDFIKEFFENPDFSLRCEISARASFFDWSHFKKNAEKLLFSEN